jgi:hypothetical protein
MRFLAWLVLLGLLVPASEAATRAWTGAAGNGAISDPDNWGGIAPTREDRLFINASVPLEVRVDSTNAVFAGIDFAGPAPVTVRGDALTLTSVSPITVNVAASAPAAVTLATSIRLAARDAKVEVRSAAGGQTVLTFARGHRLILAGGIVQFWPVGANAAYDFQADIVEESTTSVELYGEGTHTLAGANSFTGRLLTFASKVTVARPQSLGHPSATVRMQGAGELVLAPGTYTQAITILTTSAGLAIRTQGEVKLAGTLDLRGFPRFITEGELSVDGSIIGFAWAFVESRGKTIFRGDASGFDGMVYFRSGLSRISSANLARRELRIEPGATVEIEAGQDIENFVCSGILRPMIGSGYIRTRTTATIDPQCSVEPMLSPLYRPPANGVIGVLDLAAPRFATLPEGRVVVVGGVPMTVTYTATGSRGALGFIPTVLRTTGASSLVMATGATGQRFTIRAADATGRTAAGMRIVFSSTCGTFEGAASVEVVVDSAGVATSPPFTPGWRAGNCTVNANFRDAPAGAAASFAVRLYDPAFNLQDMWWAGTAENGWGMSIVQHRDTLFAVIYAYDAAGNPTWYVMPGGAWDDSNRAFSGALFQPRGAPFYAYDASRFSTGAPVGLATLTFANGGAATLDYNIGGVAVRKQLTRQLFGPPATAPLANLGDMWWGGTAQNGWGIAVLQQQATLFSVWFTYDAAGAPTWYVLPGGAWTASDTYEGTLYRTHGAPWLGGNYDPAVFDPIAVGSFRLRFGGNFARFDYSVDTRSGTLELARQPF